MAADADWGFTLNTKTIGFILSFAALMGLFWKTIGYANQMDFRITSTEQRIVQTDDKIIATNKSVETFGAKVDALRADVTELTIAIRSLENETRGPRQ